VLIARKSLFDTYMIVRTFLETRMRIRSTVGLGFIFSLLAVADSAHSQVPTAGSRDANGRILTKVVVTMNEPGAFGRPASGLGFLFVAGDGDRVSVRTNEAGVASTWLAPGEYRLVTPDPLEWDGYAYTWDRMISITTRTALFQLTQNEARSIAEADFAKAKVTRTSEPEGLSSTPRLWKASAVTEDLRKPAPRSATREVVEKNPESVAEQVAPIASRARKSARVDRSPAPTRHGMWFNLGTGYGAITCATCTDAYGGYSGGLSIGGTIASRLRLGLGTTSWYKSEDGLALLTGTIDARARFYPGTVSGFFVTGGFGVGSIGADLSGYGSGSEFGMGSVAGIGWDVSITNSVAFTPYWNFFNVTTSNTNTTVGQIGVGLTFHQ
jgi:hypothetical protein